MLSSTFKLLVVLVTLGSTTLASPTFTGNDGDLQSFFDNLRDYLNSHGFTGSATQAGGLGVNVDTPSISDANIGVHAGSSSDDSTSKKRKRTFDGSGDASGSFHYDADGNIVSDVTGTVGDLTDSLGLGGAFNGGGQGGSSGTLGGVVNGVTGTVDGVTDSLGDTLRGVGSTVGGLTNTVGGVTGGSDGTGSGSGSQSGGLGVNVDTPSVSSGNVGVGLGSTSSQTSGDDN